MTRTAIEPLTPEWHEARRHGIGASEIAAVLGISPWESPLSLYWRKREGWEVEETEQMRTGRIPTVECTYHDLMRSIDYYNGAEWSWEPVEQCPNPATHYVALVRRMPSWVWSRPKQVTA